MQRLEVEVGVQHAVDVADGREPTLEREGTDVLGEDRAADGVDDEVGAAPAGRGPHRGREIGAAGGERHVEAEARERVELARRSRGADDVRAEHLRELERGDADARGHAVDEHPFAGLHAALQHQHVVGDEKGERDRGGFLPRERGRHGHRLGRFHQRVLRERTGAATHDAVARPECGHVGAGIDDLAGAFGADLLPLAGLVQAVAAHELAAVERSGVHAHQQLARVGHGHRSLARLERSAGIARLHPDRLHGGVS